MRGDSFDLPPRLWSLVSATLDDWQRHGKVGRLWSGDPSLWTGDDEGSWLGWLGITKDQLAPYYELVDKVEAAIKR